MMSIENSRQNAASNDRLGLATIAPIHVNDVYALRGLKLKLTNFVKTNRSLAFGFQDLIRAIDSNRNAGHETLRGDFYRKLVVLKMNFIPTVSLRISNATVEVKLIITAVVFQALSVFSRSKTKAKYSFVDQ